MDKVDTFGISLAVMMVCAIVLGQLIDPAWVGGFLAFLIGSGTGTYLGRRKRRDSRQHGSERGGTPR